MLRDNEDELECREHSLYHFSFLFVAILIVNLKSDTDLIELREQYLARGIYMAQSKYLTGAYWKCNGPIFNFYHESRLSRSSCMVVGKVSRHGCSLAPYGDFKIDEDNPTDFKNTAFRFTLVRPDKRTPDFQKDFDNVVISIETIATKFPGIKSSRPFLSCDAEGWSLNFAYRVFNNVR